MKRYLFLLLLSLCCIGIPPFVVTAQKTPKTDTFSVYFDYNVSTLNAVAKDKIDSLFHIGFLFPGQKVTIVGYADYVGEKHYNIQLSQKRALNVADYLLGNAMNKKNILIVLGKGKIESRPKEGVLGNPLHRRVDIVLRHNNMPGKDLNTQHVVMKPRVAAPPSPHEEKLKQIPGHLRILENLDTGKTLRLNNIYFPMEMHTAKPESLPELENLYQMMEMFPALRIRIEGHICCVQSSVGDAWDIESKEFFLSRNRAKYIYDYLVGKGIAANRLEYAGYGKSRPVVKVELNEIDAQKNRRVEIRVLSR